MKCSVLISAGLAALQLACNEAAQPPTGVEGEPDFATAPAPGQASDKNVDPAASPPDVRNSAVTTRDVPQHLLPLGAVQAAAVAPTIAIATMPAPSSSFQIRVTLTNLSRNSTVGSRRIRAAIVDCHRAFNERSLTIDQVFNVQSPPSGSATVTTGNDANDVGPAVLTFQGLDVGESSAFTLDPDTWDNPDFGATRTNLAGCNLEVVFLGNLRGDGRMVVLANGSVRASVIQRNP